MGVKFMNVFVACVLICCFEVSVGEMYETSGKHGVIESPKFPNPYENSVNQTWKIVVEKGYRIVLYFTTFDLEDSYDGITICPNDRVEIIDVNEESNVTTNVRLCGRSSDHLPDAPILYDKHFQSTSNIYVVNFISDFSNDVNFAAPKGFKANYYQEDIDECKEMELEYDKSEDPPSFKKCDHYCNNYPGGYYCSCRDGYTKPGNDRFACIGQCSGNVIKDAEGDIASPGFPGNYPKSTDCDWTITTLPGNVIHMTFQPNFGIEGYIEQGLCPYDYVKIIDSKKTVQMCDSYFPYNATTVTSYGNKVTIEFHSDHFLQKSGFKLHYRSSAVICSMPAAPTYGRILQTYGSRSGELPFNSVVVFECQRGTKLVGVHKIKCLKDGSWSSKVPTCVKK